MEPRPAVTAILAGTLLALLSVLALAGRGQATHDPNDFFSPETSPTSNNLGAIHGASSTSLQASATSSTSWARRTGSGWVSQTATFGSTALYFASATNGFTAFPASSGVSTYATWDGSSWTNQGTIASFTTAVSAHGTSASNIYIAGSFRSGSTTSARVALFNGASFTIDLSNGGCQSTEQLPARFESVHARAATDVWAVCGSAGPGGLVASFVHHKTTTWDAGTPLPFYPRAVFGVASGDAWAVGDACAACDSNIYHLSGGVWAGVTNPSGQSINSVWAASSSDVWFVGNGGTILHWDGTSLTVEPPANSQNLRSVFGLSATDVWAVGNSGTILKLSVNANNILPVLTGLQWDPSDMIVHAEDACLGDEVELTINLEPSLGAGGVNWYVINSDSNTVVETGTAAQFNNLQNKHYHTSRSYPAGDYTFLATADVTGLLSPDNWAAEGFNVNTGTCYTAADSQLIQDRFDTVDSNIANLQNDVDWINATTIRGETNLTHLHNDLHATQSYQNARANDTRAHLSYQNAQLNATATIILAGIGAVQIEIDSVHAHIDSHFTYTNSLINLTRQDVQAVNLTGNFTGGDLLIQLNQTLNHLNASHGGILGLSSLPTMAVQDSNAVLVFFILMIWAMYQGYFLVGFMSFVGCLMIVVENQADGIQFEHSFLIGFLLILIAFWMESLVRGWKLRKAGPMGKQ